jgi:hypothetical protein
LIGACCGSGDRERLGSGSRPSDHPKHHALLRATVASLDPLKPAFWGQPSVAIGWGAGSAPSLERGPRWVHYSAAPDLTPGSWLVLGVHRLVARRLGVRLLRPGSWRSPQGHHGASLSVGVVASRHVPSADVPRRRLMVSGPSCPVEELWCAPSCHPTSSRRWDVRATWSRSCGGGAGALSVRGSRSSMIAGGPEGSQIPLSPTRQRAWWKVERGLDSLSVVP